MRRWPPILGLRNALTATLTYMRWNRDQAEIAESYGVSQPTISRAISAITPLLVQALRDYVPTADHLDPGQCRLVQRGRQILHGEIVIVVVPLVLHGE